MPSKTKCKHARLSREKVCYECGQFVDLSDKKHKYSAEKTTVDGIPFGSKREAKRYQDLKLLQKSEHIGGLCADKSKLRWDLAVNGQLICRYEADFAYVLAGPYPQKVVEDSKGFRTPVYRLKKKLMKAIHGIEISEV